MDADKIIRALKRKYPGKRIFKNIEKQPTEIICEVEPTDEHPEYSVAIAVIDRSVPHYHQKTEEVYEVIEGELDLFIDGESIKLRRGGKHTIMPGERHYVVGQEAWIKTTAKPGWKSEDHILV